ncbi:unnamed protein product [Protopolystoma xenopodis]|uniref:Secreted protein n=1 Tax=Protopolystoma xenopodis TaxID=117903 RepID=A0A3S5AHV7_9PLAT|nr:unnamed protein product [Protopolystoma xenopodis]
MLFPWPFMTHISCLFGLFGLQRARISRTPLPSAHKRCKRNGLHLKADTLHSRIEIVHRVTTPILDLSGTIAPHLFHPLANTLAAGDQSYRPSPITARTRSCFVAVHEIAYEVVFSLAGR